MEANDLKAILEFINTILYGEFGFQPSEDLDYDLENIEEIYSPPDGIFYIVLVDDEIIGTAGLRKLENDSAELKRMFIKKEFRGQGLGTALMEKLIEFACHQDYKRIYLDSNRSLKAAQALYKKFGFQETERYNDNFRADIFMVKEL